MDEDNRNFRNKLEAMQHIPGMIYLKARDINEKIGRVVGGYEGTPRENGYSIWIVCFKRKTDTPRLHTNKIGIGEWKSAQEYQQKTVELQNSKERVGLEINAVKRE